MKKTVAELWKEACETPVPVNVDLTQPTDSRDIEWELNWPNEKSDTQTD